MIGRQAVPDEAGSEDGRQGPAEVIAEGCADCPGTAVGHPVSLGCDGATGDAEGEFAEAGVEAEDFVGLRLWVVAGFEEGRDADEADLVVPHDRVGFVWFVGQAEGVLEDWKKVRLDEEAGTDRNARSNASRPVLSEKAFFSLL